MAKVRLISWSPGLDKVSLTKLLRSGAEIPLNEAHEAVNRLLAGNTVDITVLSEQRAQQLAHDVRALGVGAECIQREISAKR